MLSPACYLSCYGGDGTAFGLGFGLCKHAKIYVRNELQDSLSRQLWLQCSFFYASFKLFIYLFFSWGILVSFFFDNPQSAYHRNVQFINKYISHDSEYKVAFPLQLSVPLTNSSRSWIPLNTNPPIDSSLTYAYFLSFTDLWFDNLFILILSKFKFRSCLVISFCLQQTLGTAASCLLVLI